MVLNIRFFEGFCLWNLMVFNGIQRDFHRILMGFKGFLMGFKGILMEFNDI